MNLLTNQSCSAVDETIQKFDAVVAEIVDIGASGSIEIDAGRWAVASNPEVQP